MLVLTTNNKSVDWISSSWKSSSPPPCLCMCKWKWGKRHAWIKSSVDNKTKGNEGCKQWLHICKLRFMMFNFGARWDQAFFAKGCKLSYNPVYVITDHSALTTRSQVYSACLLCHFENTLSFNAEKINRFNILLKAHPNHLIFSPSHSPHILSS